MVASDAMEKIVALCKRRGFVYPGSEIYGGIGGFWDFGPLGVALKNNIKRLWWKAIVEDRGDVYGLDSTIIHHPKVWEASGHILSFTDPLVECKSCHRRFRADKVGERCPDCDGRFTEVRQFNMMFKTQVGPVEDSSSTAYLRPETAQGIFINFANIVDSLHPKLPFGIAQIGKGFRNEITHGDFIFRDREFEMMELEFFVRPGEDDQWYAKWIEERMKWHESMGLSKKHLRLFEHPKHALSHYSKRTVDIEYDFPFGFSELEGIANRTDFDLKNHSKHSGRDLSFTDEGGKKFYPFVIEPSLGVERMLLAILCDAYYEDGDPTDGSGQVRVVLKLKPQLAPYKVAVFPLVSNKEELVKKARSVYSLLSIDYSLSTAWDDRGNIGKRYYSQDEIGTPWCVTVDYQTLEDDTVTIRDRDTTKQERVAVSGLKDLIDKRLANNEN